MLHPLAKPSYHLTAGELAKTDMDFRLPKSPYSISRCPIYLASHPLSKFLSCLISYHSSFLTSVTSFWWFLLSLSCFKMWLFTWALNLISSFYPVHSRGLSSTFLWLNCPYDSQIQSRFLLSSRLIAPSGGTRHSQLRMFQPFTGLYLLSRTETSLFQNK